jgi:hypothetical protein
MISRSSGGNYAAEQGDATIYSAEIALLGGHPTIVI